MSTNTLPPSDSDGKQPHEIIAAREIIPENLKNEHRRNLHFRADVSYWETENFLPPADLLSEYKKLDQNLFNDIVEEWKKEGAQRRELEKNDSQSEKEGRNRGQHFSLYFSLAFFGLAAYSLYLGHVAVAVCLASGNFILVAGNLLWHQSGGQNQINQIRNILANEAADPPHHTPKPRPPT